MLSTALKDTAKDTAKDPESLKSAGDTTTTDKDPARMKPLSIVDPSDDDKAEVPAWRAHLGKLFAPLRRAYGLMSFGQKVLIGVLIGLPCFFGVAIVVKGIYDYVECGGHSTQGRRLMKSSDPNPCKDSKYKYAETDCLAIHGSGKGQWTCDFTNWATSNDKKEKNTAVFNTFTWEYRAITSWDMQLPADKTIEESSKYWRDKNQCDGVFRFWQAGGEDDCTVFIKAPANWITAPDLDQQGAYESCGRYGPLCSNGDVSDLFVWKTVDKKIVDLSLGDEHPDFSYILGRFSDLSKWYAKSLAAKVVSSYLRPTEEEFEAVKVFEQRLRDGGGKIPDLNVMISLLRDKRGNADEAANAYIKAYTEANSFHHVAKHFDKDFLAKKEAVSVFKSKLIGKGVKIPERWVITSSLRDKEGNADEAAMAYIKAAEKKRKEEEEEDARRVQVETAKHQVNQLPEWAEAFDDEDDRVKWYMASDGDLDCAINAKKVLKEVWKGFPATAATASLENMKLVVEVWRGLTPTEQGQGEAVKAAAAKVVERMTEKGIEIPSWDFAEISSDEGSTATSPHQGSSNNSGDNH